MISFFLVFPCFTHAKTNEKKSITVIFFAANHFIKKTNGSEKNKKIIKTEENYNFAQKIRVQLFVISLKWFNDELLKMMKVQDKLHWKKNL